jgi:hypothetical protein
MIDSIWEMWRLRQQTRKQRETDYPPDNMGMFFEFIYVACWLIPRFRLHATLAFQKSKATFAQAVKKY